MRILRVGSAVTSGVVPTPHRPPAFGSLAAMTPAYPSRCQARGSLHLLWGLRCGVPSSQVSLVRPLTVHLPLGTRVAMTTHQPSRRQARWSSQAASLVGADVRCGCLGILLGPSGWSFLGQSSSLPGLGFLMF